MHAEGRDQRIVQRGIDEAYACQDMLSPAPERPSLFARMTGRIGNLLRGAGARIPREGSSRRIPPRTITDTIR